MTFLKKKKRGVSLIEILLATLIFSLVFAAAFKSLFMMTKVQKKADELAVVSQVLSDVTEKITNLRNTGGYDIINSNMYFNSSNIPSLAKLDSATITNTVSNYMGSTDLKEITVTLTWNSFEGITKTETFQTITSRPPTNT